MNAATPLHHLQTIEESLNELASLSLDLGAPASIQHQYIGTCVDNTLVLLTGVANSIDGGGRNIGFSEYENWRSAMVAVHRSFYSGIIISTEKACSDLCAAKEIIIKSKRLQTAQKVCEALRNVGIKDLAQRQKLEKIILALAGSKPGFLDYIDIVTDSSRLPSDRVKMWRRYFAALSTIRNKVSHSDVSLSESEAKCLKESGFAALVSATNDLQLNTRNYKQICEHVVLFFKEVC